jgi:hypothetical protein
LARVLNKLAEAEHSLTSPLSKPTGRSFRIYPMADSNHPQEAVPAAITVALRILLNEKHLYQHVDVQWESVRAMFKGQMYAQAFENQAFNLLARKWIPALSMDDESAARSGFTRFQLPPLTALCDRCGKVYPFNPYAPPPLPGVSLTITVPDQEANQVFALPYLCQGCKTTPVTFMVTRAVTRLTLSGRSAIETVDAPQFVRKDLRHFYSGAVLAYNCNQLLPALFMLRTLIEQYMRSMVGEDYKTGDELCEAYNKTLDETFKRKFPSLGDIYGKLSAALHEAREDRELFEAEKARIERHLDARRLWNEG